MAKKKTSKKKTGKVKLSPAPNKNAIIANGKCRIKTELELYCELTDSLRSLSHALWGACSSHYEMVYEYRKNLPDK